MSTNKRYDLPEPFYYTFEDAANELSCTKDYLLHLAETGRLATIARNSNWDLRAIDSNTTHKSLPDTFDFIEVPAYMFRTVSDDSIQVVNDIPAVYFLKNNTLERVTTNNQLYSDLEIYFYTLTAKNVDYELEPVAFPEVWVDMNKLFIPATEVHRLKNGLAMPSSHTNDLNQPPRQIHSADMTNLKAIAIMAVLLSDKAPSYKRGDKPNASTIKDEVATLAANYFGKDVRGFESFNKRLAEAMKTLE